MIALQFYSNDIIAAPTAIVRQVDRSSCRKFHVVSCHFTYPK